VKFNLQPLAFSLFLRFNKLARSPQKKVAHSHKAGFSDIRHDEVWLQT
jgi:hypothetical protein